MVHQFTTNGDLARAVERRTRHFFESRVYRTCSKVTPPLPSTVTKFFHRIINEGVYYRDQILNVIEVSIALTEERPKGVHFVPAFIVTQILLITSLDDPRITGEMEKMAPSLLSWYRYFGSGKRLLTNGMKARIDDYKRSRSILEHTPAEAAILYQAQASKRSTPLQAGPGYVQIDFFLTLEKGKYGLDNTNKADFSTVMRVHPSKGVDLRLVREKLGVESLAIIANKGPFRPIFELANEDWMSPIAALDLSKQFTQPIRVFEPRVANATKIKRHIREPIYYAIIFTLTFLNLIIGTPEKDTAFIGALFSSRYATFYASAGLVTSVVNKASRHCLNISLRCVLALSVIPLMALYAFLVFSFHVTKLVTLRTYGSVHCITTTLLSYVSAVAIDLAIFALGLDMKGWLIVFVIVWVALADHYSCTQ